MQKRHAELSGLRLMIWGAILFALLFVAALLLDSRGGERVEYADAVLVRVGETL